MQKGTSAAALLCSCPATSQGTSLQSSSLTWHRETATRLTSLLLLLTHKNVALCTVLPDVGAARHAVNHTAGAHGPVQETADMAALGWVEAVPPCSPALAPPQQVRCAHDFWGACCLGKACVLLQGG